MRRTTALKHKALHDHRFESPGIAENQYKAILSKQKSATKIWDEKKQGLFLERTLNTSLKMLWRATGKQVDSSTNRELRRDIILILSLLYILCKAIFLSMWRMGSFKGVQQVYKFNVNSLWMYFEDNRDQLPKAWQSIVRWSRR